MKFCKNDLCAFRCARKIEPVLIRADVEDCAKMAFIGSGRQTSACNLLFLCHTNGEFDNPHEAIVHYSSEIILNFAGVFLPIKEIIENIGRD